jgi:nucleotide-binding universal stress UspA family protein
MQFKHILFPFDYSDRCRHAAPFVKAWVERSGARLTILNVVEDPGVHLPAGARFLIPRKEPDEILAASTGFLREYATETFPGKTVEIVCRMGDPAKEIACVASETLANLIMMPTRGSGRFRAFVLGSVTAKVLNDAECPVWTDAHMEEHQPVVDLGIHNIVCAADDTEQSVWLLKAASGIADLYSATLHLIHVVPEVEVYSSKLRAQWQHELLESGRLKMSELRHGACVTAEIHIESGPISHMVRKAALECKADLVVIGRGHAHGLLGRLRTNAYAIVRDSPSPVLSV